MKDWSGGYASIFKTLGASNHVSEERAAGDYYATDPIAIDKLVKAYKLPHTIWECACGEGHLAKRLEELEHNVYASDLVHRGYGEQGVDFLMSSLPYGIQAIVTNPPYKYAMEFVLHAIDILPIGGVCAMFLKTTFLEGKTRRERLFTPNPPRYMFQFSERVLCAKNGDFEGMSRRGGSAVSYAWYIWEKGYKGDTIVRWI